MFYLRSSIHRIYHPKNNLCLIQFLESTFNAQIFNCIICFTDSGSIDESKGDASYINRILEAVADLIASSSAATHRLAMSQMRGGFSKELTDLRNKLLNFTSMIELELDFSEEDVEFADRSALRKLADEIEQVISRLVPAAVLDE